ncbi:MAG: FAD-dependent oxidoreductase [Gammaproteobacteria bacterium]|nr:FAD-dependent oxidoreductase [Gammaproteobacteria bacterium]MDD9850309.1 FAD-dependent oxidoreductase [Gammaproteobacteria bacterium]MDD9870920.1 FAD-dependent oxidoreductase [Gammaproteobacteria bacterium]
MVGAGPAGLACAHQLALFGHAVTVFEKQKKPGGLNEFGIAAYKTVDDFARREVEYILAVGGIEMRAGAELGRDITLEELRGEFDAVFLSPGLGGVNRAGVEGEGLDGVMDAVGFIAALRQAEDKSRIKVGKKIVVIGGGMTAIDIAVQTRKLGAEEVTIVYRRGPEDMRASRHEQDFARSNGVHFRCNARPARFIGEGTVRAAEFTVDGGETITLAADMVFTAIGQALGGGIPEGLSTADGRISVTADRATSIPGVWAGGDCVAGGDNLTVTAVEDGKVAARSIHRFLGGGHG